MKNTQPASSKLEENKRRQYYFTTENLGTPNIYAAIGNPLKGLMGSPRWSPPSTWPDTIPASLEHVYIGLDELLVDDPDKVGNDKAYNWNVLEEILNSAASRNRHVVFVVYLHYPGQPLRIPQYLIDGGIEMREYPEGDSPYYGDPILLKAFGQYIKQLGRKFDGDKRICAINMGLLGFWGEWHTHPHHFVPEYAKESICKDYIAAFKHTQLQSRFPFKMAYDAGLGMGDGSFCHLTLDGEANGGVENEWCFWPKGIKAGQMDFWRRGIMGGETRPELQSIVFKEDYPAGSEYHQDFIRCVETTHASFMLHQDCFANGDGYSGKELAYARMAHASMGYNFRVSRVCAAKSSEVGLIDADVTVMQTGVAPFYYPLTLCLECSDGYKQTQNGVEEIIDSGETKIFSFHGITATSLLQPVNLSLKSPYTFLGRPVKFAQGIDGTVSLRIPLPSEKLQKNRITKVDSDTVQSAQRVLQKNEPFYFTEIFVDATTDDNENFTAWGDTYVYRSNMVVSGNGSYDEHLFRSHRWGHEFTVEICGLQPGSLNKLSMGFAELFFANKGRRVMDIMVNDKVFLSDLDVCSVVGQATALIKTMTVEADRSGCLLLAFSGTVDNPMFSFIQIHTLS